MQARGIDPASFFRALSSLVPEGSVLHLEGGAHPAPLRQFLEAHAVVSEIQPARGTAWPRRKMWPIAVSVGAMSQLAELAERCAEPEVCDHLFVSNAQTLLLAWYDAFADPLSVSKELAREQLELFCGALKASWTGSSVDTSNPAICGRFKTGH